MLHCSEWVSRGATLTCPTGGRAGGPGAKAPEELGLLDLVLAVGRALDRVLVPHSGVGLLEQQLGDTGDGQGVAGQGRGGGITPGASEERRTRPAGPEGCDPVPSSTPGLDGTWRNLICRRCPCPWVEFPKLFPTPNGLLLLLWLTQALLKAPPTPVLARAGSSSLFFLA